MKSLIGLFALTFAASSLASTGESKSFVFDGSQNSIELVLRGEESHTEYTVEDRRSTCYRTEMAGYRTICTGYGHPGPGYPYPGRGPGRYPHPGHYPRGPRHCFQEPIYRQVAYSCTQTVRLPYQVKDFDVEARVIIDVTSLAASAKETFKVTLLGDKLSIQAVGSGKNLLVLKKDDARRNVNGSVKFIDALYVVDVIPAAPVVKALSMNDIAIENSVLRFNLGPVADKISLGFALNIVRKRPLISDIILFDRELAATEVELITRATDASLGVNVENLGVQMSGGKFALTAKAFFKADGKLMNGAQFGESLETSRTLIYTIR